MDFILGSIVGAAIALGFVTLFLRRPWLKPEQSVIDEMIDYLEVISLPCWSNGATRNWLENQLWSWKKTRKDSRGAHTDAQFLVHLFLELGKHGDGFIEGKNPKATVSEPIVINFEGRFDGEYCYRAICTTPHYMEEYGDSAEEAYDLAVSAILTVRESK